MGPHTRVELRIPMSGAEARLLAVLGSGHPCGITPIGVARSLITTVIEGVRRPHSWQRKAVVLLFGSDWAELLEPDPNHPGCWRPRPGTVN